MGAWSIRWYWRDIGNMGTPADGNYEYTAKIWILRKLDYGIRKQFIRKGSIGFKELIVDRLQGKLWFNQQR
jgi:hypothetical protein